MIVITLRVGQNARGVMVCDPRRRREYRLYKNAGAGQVARGSSTESMERRAWGGAVGPRGRSRHGGSCSGTFGSDEAAAQGRSLELDAMGAMDDAVEDGVGQGGIAEHGAMPQ